jgi:hypothetical protein
LGFVRICLWLLFCRRFQLINDNIQVNKVYLAKILLRSYQKNVVDSFYSSCPFLNSGGISRSDRFNQFPTSHALDRVGLKSSQVKLFITNNAICIAQRASEQPSTSAFCGYCVAEVPPEFQLGWSDCIYFFSFVVRPFFSSGISE